ncbi:hypothetical protein [Paraglaciecola sp.]|uniref:hypothetical protein n=1 Tax=Paraglaciecola sp. TaxID=1920173 RepID=UPI003EF324C1
MQKLTVLSLLLCSASAFSGTLAPTPVSAPGTLAILGAGVAVALYLAKKRK